MVGLLIGVPIAALLQWAPVGVAAARVPLLAAGAVMVVNALVTRMIHLDGLADVADGWWTGEDAAERLRVMRDPAVGAFGVSVVVLTLIVQAGALSAILAARSTLPLALVPALGRSAVASACWFGRPARPDGLGRIFIGPPPRRALVAGGLSLVAVSAAAWVLTGRTGAAFVIAGLVVAALVPHAVGRRFGGMTGDVLGASCVLVETVLYAASALWGLGA